METKKIIEINNLIKKFGHKIANDGINLSINKGERIGLIGANGAGKTTLVEQIVGTSKPTSGEIKYNFDYKKSPQEKMGMQFQDSSYPEGLSVKDIIEFSLSIYGSKINSKDLNNIIKIFQMQEFLLAKVKSLSGGQQQKLNVLLAVAHHPEIVILDEISTGLDISAKEEILGFVESFVKKESTTTILISHNMNEIKRLCNRIVILKEGIIHYDGTIKKIEDKYGTLENYMREFISNNGGKK